jgi:hypothetical protein
MTVRALVFILPNESDHVSVLDWPMSAPSPATRKRQLVSLKLAEREGRRQAREVARKKTLESGTEGAVEH